MAEPRPKPPFSIDQEENAKETADIEVTVELPLKIAPRGPSLLIADLGWTTEEAAETRARLRPFAEEWDDAAMSLYDDL